jgi:transposase
MPRYIHSDKEQDNLFIPLKLSEQIVEGTLAATIRYMVDTKIDMSIFDEKIKNDQTGRPAYNPRVLLKLILFAYSNGINSSRRIHDFAEHNVQAMALAENQTPDFTVIADFISGMTEQIKPVFINILLVADQMNLLGNTVFALDGCKLPSNAGKEQSGTFSDLRKKQQKLKDKITTIIDNNKALDSQSLSELPPSKQKAIDKLEKQIQKINGFLSVNEPRIGKRNKESQSNITDNESCKMKTGHGVIQGYNGQAVVDDKHQLIVAAEAFGKGQDSSLLKPMLEETAENYKDIGKSDDYIENKCVIADTGYFSEENLTAAQENKIDAFIPDQNFRKRDVRFETKGRHVPHNKDSLVRDNFSYDKEKDAVICPAGQVLPPAHGAIRKLKNYSYKTYHTSKAVCAACPLRSKCLKSEKSRWRNYQVLVDSDKPDVITAMINKIDSPHGREVYLKRMGIVEPVFADIRTQKRLDHFTLRSQAKVNIQWLLYCIVHNLVKITNFGPALQGI